MKHLTKNFTNSFKSSIIKMNLKKVFYSIYLYEYVNNICIYRYVIVYTTCNRKRVEYNSHV